jgi:hypothetical protein
VIAIVGVLIWFANFAQPVQVADATVLLTPSPYVGLLTMTVAGHVENNSVPLQVTGTFALAGASTTMLELQTRPFGEPSWNPQSECCAIVGNTFGGSASLSATSAQDFEFQLTSVGDNILLAHGTIQVHLESFPGGSQIAINIIGGLGVLAAFADIVRLVWQHRTSKANQSTGRGESNAKKPSLRAHISARCYHRRCRGRGSMQWR